MELVLVLALVWWFSFRWIAGTDTTIGRICFLIWNTMFKLAAFIPFCGWMTCFIITKNDEKAKTEKEYYVQMGKEAVDRDIEFWDRKAQRERDEENARQEQLTRQAAARRELEEDLRGRAYRKLGTRDVHLNRDGTMVKVGDSDYMSVEQFKRKMR